VRLLPGQYASYDAPATGWIARHAGIRPEEVLRFDGNTIPRPPPSARLGVLEEELGRINTYPHGGYAGLPEAIARYAGVEADNVVLGAGADDLVLLVVRSFAGRGDRVAIANDPTYPLFRIAVWSAGAEVGGDDVALTICCRPNNPTGELGDVPEARPLLVDEAYFEYSGVTALDLIDDGVVVVRTFSKAFGLAGARVGYGLAAPNVAAELNRRQHPAPLSTLSVALALAALEEPPDVRATVQERERLAAELRRTGLDPWPSRGNFLYVPFDGAENVAEQLLRQGIAVRRLPGAIRITVRDEVDDDRLVGALRTLRG
jgi:histidinol-phosphate/aromatic aminotransferase/cobyric acid decarboxylase-like protein